MIKFNKTASIISIVLALCSSSALANNGMVAIGPKIGTQGIGLEARTPITENFFGRIGGNFLEYSKDYDDGEIKYKGKLKLLTAPLMIDYHPFNGSGFRISVGGAYNGNKLTAKATPSKSITLYGRTYTPKELGTINSELKLGSTIAAIATIGYDSSFVGNSPLSFSFEAGAMYSGKPKLKISATGQAANQTQKLDDLRKDANKSLNDIKKYLQFYPVLSIGLKYSF
jgi:hypothetical protein